MRKSLAFRPNVQDQRLEERIALSAVSHAPYTAPLHKPVVSSAAVARTDGQIHNALLSYERSVTNSVLYAESQINAGHITPSTAVSLLETYIGNKTSLLFYQVRGASGNLPYGSGFNAYVNSTATGAFDTPSGADSLYAGLTFPSNGSLGPIGNLQNNVYNELVNQNFAGVINAVNTAAIHSTYASVKSVVNSYVVAGVRAREFSYQG